jgi:hypothetical protein
MICTMPIVSGAKTRNTYLEETMLHAEELSPAPEQSSMLMYLRFGVPHLASYRKKFIETGNKKDW